MRCSHAAQPPADLCGGYNYDFDVRSTAIRLLIKGYYPAPPWAGTLSDDAV